jgi:hypothetical protein
MERDELLSQYFNTDVSGNDTEGIKKHYVRCIPQLITKNKALEFEYVMDILIPEWRKDKELMQGGAEGPFTIEKVDYDNTMCICTQKISDICYLSHPLLKKSVQVGNHCVGKISEELENEAAKMQRLKKKQELDARIKKWNSYQNKLMSYHRAREERLDRERDEIVSRVEREHDIYLLSQIFRTCNICKCYNILNNEPSWKVNCYKCYKKK